MKSMAGLAGLAVLGVSASAFADDAAPPDAPLSATAVAGASRAVLTAARSSPDSSLPAPGAATPNSEPMHDGAPRAVEPHGPSSDELLSHNFQWAPHDLRRPQIGVNFGLSQLALGGFNVAAEFRYRRFWFEYSHGASLTLNNQRSLAMTQAERDQELHIDVPYTTGFGVGATLVDELWVGAEFKLHDYEVRAPGGETRNYQTYSIGPVVGYKLFLWKGLHVNGYLRYWPNVGSTLEDDRVALNGTGGAVAHDAHAFNFFANVSVGYAFDL